MKILTIGCSNLVGDHFKVFCKEFGGFDLDQKKLTETPNPSSLNNCDQKYKHNGHEWINLSMRGAGNFYICGRLFEFIEEHGRPDYVYLQFSGLTRLDLPLHKKVHVRDYFYQKETTYKNWVISGGYVGTWMQNDFLRKQLIYWYDTKNGYNIIDKSLQQIFSAISLLESYGISYNWTPYYNYKDPLTAYLQKDGTITEWPDYFNFSKKIPIDPLSFAIKKCSDVPEDGVHFKSESFKSFLKTQKAHFNVPAL